MATGSGTCPNCDSTGPVGHDCAEKGCQNRSYHFIPDDFAQQHRRSPDKLIESVIGQLIGEDTATSLTQEERDRVLHEFGLDKSIPEQFVDYVKSWQERNESMRNTRDTQLIFELSRPGRRAAEPWLWSTFVLSHDYWQSYTKRTR